MKPKVMKKKHPLSRREFFRSTALATAGIGGAASLSSCGGDRKKGDLKGIPLREFSGEGYSPEKGTCGLLFSQLGYEPGLPVRIIVRLPERELLSDTATCRLTLQDGDMELETPCSYWGEVWQNHWWVAEFNRIDREGRWSIEMVDGEATVFADKGLLVRKNVLWDETLEFSTVDMLERRRPFSKFGVGWQDAGTLWIESCAQSAMVITLAELLEQPDRELDQSLVSRICEQITVGCDYLVLTQEKARELGYPEGAMSHDLLGHEHDILPNDISKAVVAFLLAARLLPDSYGEKKKKYREAAEKAYRWLVQEAKPLGKYGMTMIQRGIPEDTPIPGDEWNTRHLVMMCHASLEKWKLDRKESSKAQCIGNAGEIMKRQIQESDPENGYFGHFLEFPGLSHSENAWIHGIAGNEFGTDIGGFYPHYLVPVIEMIRLWPEHEEAGEWKKMLESFTEGYLKPVCSKNPFHIVPLGVFGEEGPIWFCGTFHGSNAIYGFTAALALELAGLLGDDTLVEIAYGNLQWIAGLNGGITKANLRLGSDIFSTDVPEGVALPASMICGIGDRWAGTWFQTRGSICNGFSTGRQFRYDVGPERGNDGPHSLTDEDWIPHAAGWIAGLIRLNHVIEAQ